MAKLAKRTIDALKPREKAYVAYDSELHGFGVRVMPLGHSQAATTHRYAHLDADPMRRAAETIGSTIAAAMSSPSRNVVPMVKSR